MYTYIRYAHIYTLCIHIYVMHTHISYAHIYTLCTHIYVMDTYIRYERIYTCVCACFLIIILLIIILHYLHHIVSMAEDRLFIDKWNTFVYEFSISWASNLCWSSFNKMKVQMENYWNKLNHVHIFYLFSIVNSMLIPYWLEEKNNNHITQLTL